MGRKKCMIQYTVGFLVVFSLGFLAFFLQGKSLVWEGDGFRQYYPVLCYLGRYYRGIVAGLWQGDFAVPLIDFQIGQGEDIIASFSNYGLGDPLTLLSVFVPAAYTEYLYGVLVVLRLYLSGAAFLVYCWEMKQSRKYSVYGALIYVFCGYAIWSVKDPFFLNAMIYLPLVLVGIERVFRKKGVMALVFSVLFCVLSSYYFFYMIVLAAIAYFVVRCRMRYGNWWKMSHGAATGMWKSVLRDGGWCLAAGAAGTMMSGILLVPSIYGFLESSRGRASVSFSSLLLYNLDYYKNMLTHFVMVSEEKDAGAVAYCSMAVLTFVALYVIFDKRDRVAVWLKRCVIVCVCLVASPLAGYVLNGFGYVTNRFMFIPAFLLSFIVVYAMPDVVQRQQEDMTDVREKRKRKQILSILAVYVIFCLLVSGKEGILPCLFMAVMLVGTILVVAGVRSGRWRENMIFGIVLINLIGNCNMLFQGFGADVASMYLDAGTVYADYTSDKTVKTAAGLLEKSDGMERLDVMSDDGENPNQAVVAGFHGVSVYYSVINAGYSAYMMALENGPDVMFSHRILGNDGRTVLENLSAVKYVVCQREEEVPYGFHLVDGKRKLYQNENQISVGYTYDQYVSEEEFDEAGVFARQNTLLESAVLEDNSKLYEKAADSGTLQKGTVSGDVNSLAFEMTDAKSFVWDGNTLKVKKENGRFQLDFSMKKGNEYYLRLSGLQIRKADSKFLWAHVKIGNWKKKVLVCKPDYDFYFGREDYLIYLGTLGESAADEVEKELSFRINGPAEYSLNDIELVEVPVSGVSEKVQNLNREGLQGVDTREANTLQGELEVSKDKILCLAVPYREGYILYVDGRETECEKINKMYIGTWIESGKHSILLKYVTPGLRIGIIVTVFGVVFTIFLYIFNKKHCEK